MNCDQAFDMLTDSALRHSPQLQRHLDGCPRCRQMRETLEPALDLFDDVVHEPGFDPAPAAATGPMLTSEAVELAERTAAGLSQRAEADTGASGRHWTVKRVLAAAALFLLGAGVALGVSAVQRLENSPTPPNASQNCTWQHREHQPQLAQNDSRAVVISCVACHLGSSANLPLQ